MPSDAKPSTGIPRGEAGDRPAAFVLPDPVSDSAGLAGERLIAAPPFWTVATKIQTRRGTNRLENDAPGRLDATGFFSSMAVPATPKFRIPTARGHILMKRLIICLGAVCIASIGLAQDKAQLKDQKDKASYSIGYDIGETFKKQKVELNSGHAFSAI